MMNDEMNLSIYNPHQQPGVLPADLIVQHIGYPGLLITLIIIVLFPFTINEVVKKVYGIDMIETGIKEFLK